MKVIVCLDERLGMLFHNRRLSRDRKVIEDICKRTEKLYISAFSETLFQEMEVNLCVDEAFLEKASAGEVCFAENQFLKNYEEKIEELVVYQWNRSYPSDVQIDLPIHTWKMVNEEEFEGFSHEKITRQVYVRG